MMEAPSGCQMCHKVGYGIQKPSEAGFILITVLIASIYQAIVI
jgi:hypothetical protein